MNLLINQITNFILSPKNLWLGVFRNLKKIRVNYWMQLINPNINYFLSD